MIMFYSISIYITYAFEFERLKLALLYPQFCHMWKTLGAHYSFSIRPIYYALKAPTQHETSIAESPATGTCEI
jgi:hypothetical protein